MRTDGMAVVVSATLLAGAVALPAATEACTAAVIPAPAAAGERAVLWKNRDTGSLSNKVVYVAETPYSYMGVANADAASGRGVYAGLNAAGFAIINTVAYNLPSARGEMEDLEGFIMADALRTCRTVADFEAYLEANRGPDLGALANFAVIDGDGGAAVFEVHNRGFARLPLDPDKATVVTNFARTGRPGEGQGYLRFERATALFDGLPAGPVDFRAVLTRFTRDVGHVLLRHPSLPELRALPDGQPVWVSTRDCIDRPDTAAAVVVVGRRVRVAGGVATMWVIPGEPLTAVAVPVWVEAGDSPALLWQGEEAPLWRESLRIKRLLRPAEEGHKRDYADLRRLDNAAGTGYLPGLLAAEQEILARTGQFLSSPRTREDYAAFQREMAELALAAMRAVR